MKIRLGSKCPFNLEATLCCGQTFRWNKQGEWWYGVVRDKAFKLCQIGNELEFEDVDADFVKDYFGLADDLPRIYSQIGRDVQMTNAIETFRGLRILHQDPWECLISYICATYKNISAIKQMLFNLSKRFGDKIDFEGNIFHTFPNAERLAKASLKELRECSLGYRAKFVSETAKTVRENDFEFERLRRAPYERAKAELLDFPGVGRKVADCVLLFSLGKVDAFPVDVWIRRAIVRHYASYFPDKFVNRIRGQKSLTDSEYEKLNSFGRKHFGKYAGYAQEYLYHYERMQT
jgi:N-glycosylase/DNA lyase